MINTINKAQSLKKVINRIFKLRGFSTYLLNLKSFYRYKNWFEDFIKSFVELIFNYN
mgnify:CR=1 FL=1